MKRSILTWVFVLQMATASRAQEASWPPAKTKESEFTGRKVDTFQHGSKKDWGYAEPQRDTFLVLHPKEARQNAPLYVVLHSAGHDVHSCLACTAKVGNHDIYHSPPDFFALYLDCRANKGDWWWGINKYPGPEVGPTEKRVIDTVKWVVKQYGIDENRVYLCGNSMGGSGTLGIGMRHGDVFAAVKANVPAEVKHVSSRMYFPPQDCSTRSTGRASGRTSPSRCSPTPRRMTRCPGRISWPTRRPVRSTPFSAGRTGARRRR
jgi:poly(3-hydroxybutyrate) depolymerase